MELSVTIFMIGGIELFTLQDKYNLMLIAIFILIVNVSIFIKLESLIVIKKFQILNKKTILLYITSLFFLIILSLTFTIPYVEQNTIEFETILSEALIDNEKNSIKLERIENTYYPTYNNSIISWYTRDFKDERYIQHENVAQVYTINQQLVYEMNDSRYLSIMIAPKPKEHRGTETSAFWYSFTFIIYNFFIAIFAFPLFSLYNSHIKLMWKSQNMISNILLAIIVSYTFMF